MVNALFGAFLGLTLLATPAAPAEKSEAGSRLRPLLDEIWEFELREDPLMATSVGDHRYDDRLPAVRIADQARRAEARRKFLERLRAIDPAGLDETDRDSQALQRVKLEDSIREYELHHYRFPINADSGFHMELAQLVSQMPFETARDYENYLARLRAFPEYMGENVNLLREGLKAGWTLPKVALTGYEKTIEAHVVTDPTRSRFFQPFAAFPVGVPEGDRGRLRAAGEKAIRDDVVPAYRSFLEFMTRDYMPGARPTVGAGDLPGGKEYYAYLVRHFTTVDRSPEQVHALGLSEVARIRAEMEEVIRKTGFAGSFADFLKFLRTDPRFYAKTPEELLKQASWIAKRIDGRLPAFFGRLPRQPYGRLALAPRGHLARDVDARRVVRAARLAPARRGRRSMACDDRRDPVAQFAAVEDLASRLRASGGERRHRSFYRCRPVDADRGAGAPRADPPRCAAWRSCRSDAG